MPPPRIGLVTLTEIARLPVRLTRILYQFTSGCDCTHDLDRTWLLVCTFNFSLAYSLKLRTSERQYRVGSRNHRACRVSRHSVNRILKSHVQTVEPRLETKKLWLAATRSSINAQTLNFTNMTTTPTIIWPTEKARTSHGIENFIFSVCLNEGFSSLAAAFCPHHPKHCLGFLHASSSLCRTFGCRPSDTWEKGKVPVRIEMITAWLAATAFGVQFFSAWAALYSVQPLTLFAMSEDASCQRGLKLTLVGLFFAPNRHTRSMRA